MAAPSPDQPAPPGAAEVEEIDVWWGSYAGRAMLPGLLFCLLLTVFLLSLDWYLQSQNRRSDLISTALLGVAGAVWLFQGTRSVYRMIAINYRLTNRRLLITQGFHLSENRAIALAQVVDVSVTCGPIERLLRVGEISIQVQDSPSAPLVLQAVPNPERVARTIRKRVRQARTPTKRPAEECARKN